MRIALQCRAAAVLAAAMGCAALSAAGVDSPPKELVQYVQEAKRRGLTEAKIKEQARSVGWPAELVEQAIAHGKQGARLTNGKSAAPATAAPASIGPSGVGAPAVSHVASDDYLIGAGDTLQISVWKEQEVSVPTVVVRPDGKITVPLVKDVQVAGLTPGQAEMLITAGLLKFYSEPNVTVVVAAIASKKIYVIGSVRKEGTVPYTYGMTVMQALSEAGGLTDYAKRSKIYVLRTEGGREYRLDFNYAEVVRGERTEQNITLLPGDTVVIPH